ncbi:Fur family transcriptional regulator [Chloroflexota bacterium]
MRIRKSRQRETILEVVKGSSIHPTAEWIYVQSRQIMPSISLGTVYRNLRLLTEEGLILELDINGDLSRFDGNTNIHHHFICEQCGKILDFMFSEKIENAMIDNIGKTAGFKINYHRCELMGICRECQAQ